MRITYIHQYFNTPSMPGSTRSYELARRLVEMGHIVTMITSSRELDSRKDWFMTNESGVEVHWLPVPYSNNMSYRRRLFSFLKFSFFASFKAATFPADVVFATSTPLSIIFPAVYASRVRRVPMVFEVRDLWPELPIAIGAIRNPIFCMAAQLLEKFAYWSSSEIIALSPGMFDGIVSSPVPSNRVNQIPNGSDIDLFCPNLESRMSFRREHGIHDDQVLVVYVGTFGRINGVKYFVRLANALLSDTRFRFLMVGGGYEFESVKLEAQALGVLNQNLQIMQQVPKNSIPRILAAADIATSLFVPIKAMEANSANKFFDGLSSGCCMAINYGGWQSKLLEETGAGIQLSRDVLLAGHQLQQFIEDPARMLRSKAAARKLAVARFSHEKLSKELEQVLQKSIANQSP